MLFIPHKNLIIALFCALSVQFCKAQFSTGESFGLSNNYLETNISTQSFTQLQPQIGYYFCLNANYKITKKFSVALGLNSIQKNYSFKRTGVYNGIFEKHINTYLQLPFTFGFSFLQKNKWQLRSAGGGYVAYWLSSKLKGQVPDIFSVQDSIAPTGSTIEIFGLAPYNQKYSFNSKKDKRLEVGSVVCLEAIYNLDKVHELTFSLLYFQSLTSQQKKYQPVQTPRYNQTLVVSIGYIFTWKEKR